MLVGVLIGAALLLGAEPKQDGQEVKVIPNEAARRVDVLVGGQPFTSYIFPETVKKPVLYPLRTAKGTIVTRGFPLEPRPGEARDHPHQVGYWLNYGNVNNIDFWGNSDAVKQTPKLGTIRHRKITRATSGKDRGELDVEMDWLTADGKPLLHENTRFIFRAGPDLRVVDRITTLTAQDTRVVFNDDKEGMLGLRVARALEQPSKKSQADASGKETSGSNNTPNGLYRSSEGRTGDDVWGTRARWVTLTGKVGQEEVTLAILDHPKNPGYPTYWHARGYGLFAANPLGQKVFSKGKEELKLTLEPKQSATFRYRLLILSGTTTPDRMKTYVDRFVGEVP